MDVVKKGLTSMRKANKHWNIPISSLSNHLNRRNQKRKVGTTWILKEEDTTIVTWVLDMQSCRFSITLFQLKLKVAKFTQTWPSNHVFENSLCHWFKKRHPKLTIHPVKGLDIYKTQGLTSQSCNSFYENLQASYS
jgi:hypothetical protein